jgi:solute carrier family 25 folate transporter 32
VLQFQAAEIKTFDNIVIFPDQDPTVPISFKRILLCSAIAKMTASIATYPHEVIRTRLQTQRLPLADDASSDGMVKSHLRRGIIYTTKKIIVKEGWTALYKGLSINLFRTVPNSAATILTWVLLFNFCVDCKLTCLVKLRVFDQTSSIVILMN